MTTTEPDTGNLTTAGEILDAAREALGPDVPMDVEQTGGGVATLFFGETRIDAEGIERQGCLLGPGTYDWGAPRASEFWLGYEAVALGPDDEGQAECAYPTDVAEAVEAIRGYVAQWNAAT